ncbi:MAG TPA: class I adenylate-forming enzyme family protein [Solirubrobacteraceae bacterium]|nr:class I adenylate-forming enzyme family protein [Solirubrobacteraceae bacterium]
MSDQIGTAAVRAAAAAAWERHLGEPVDRERLLARLTAGSLHESFHATAVAGPDRPAIEIGSASVTHGELDALAARMASALADREVAPGDAVLLTSPSSLALITAYLGVLRLGAVAVPANPDYTAPELRHLIGDSGAVLVLASGAALERARVAAGGGGPEGAGGAAGGGGPEGAGGAAGGDAPEVLDLDELVNNLPGAALDPVPRERDSVALLAYTSGTTGKPKCVPLTHANLLASVRGYQLAWRWSPDDVLVHGLPLFHQHGLGGVHATLLAGSRAHILPRFDAAALCAAIAAARGTVLFCVPAMYERLVRWEGIEGAELGSLRLLISGSAPLSPSLAREATRLIGQQPLDRYGTTESGLDVSTPYDGPRRIGMVGLALPGIEVAVVDPDGVPLAPGTDGEIVVRGPHVFSGYRGDVQATAGTFYPGGWFRTGDLGRVDPGDGYLQITGRAKELIITGGLNVYPREVEHALEEHAGVAAAAVVGVPSERWGEEVVAAIVAAGEGGVDEHELIAFARSLLAPYKCPKRVVVVSELPRNALGKVVASEVLKVVGPSGA